MVKYAAAFVDSSRFDVDSSQTLEKHFKKLYNV